ncbi:unnamed protein product [Tuber melanosporum]|uniref:Glycerol-3-phosphate dehydrogenase n=1 Tax=Tuber melanosporum (strain Mel28) TaxID=656061 RepID=D5G9A1_TUBMM|nr:uncharacterized protein GSTUM_00003213001 [Tuber melanosporum]CAZ81094.1 unnamed protein product [Tuber melanosporum]
MAGARSSMGSLRRPFLIGTTVAVGGFVAYKSYSPRPASHTYSVGKDRDTASTDGRPNVMGRVPAPPKFPPLPTREEQINRLRAGTEGSGYDLLVIGGGATGSGIALDAASRGLKVAMVERDDFSSGTSSKSTKLVHGGVRYLEKAVKELDYSQYQLVKEALKERAVFLTTAPHLSMSLPIMLPVYEWWKAPYFWVGTKVYDFLAGKENLESSYFLTRGKALEAFPMLKGNGLAGALVYYDGSHNDSRMNVSIALTAALYGATIANHVEVNELIKDPATGKVTGVKEEINWILNEVRRYLAPDINVRRGDVLAAWSGIRPLVKDPDAKNTESLVRNHLINVSDNGLITIAGGKWTTYRQMAEEAVDEAVRRFNLKTGPIDCTDCMSTIPESDGGVTIDGKCRTDQLKLIGAHGYNKTLFINLIQHFGVETEVAQHLAGAYGDRAWIVASLSAPTSQRFPVRGKRLSTLYPFIDGEVRYAVRHEYAQTAVDVIARRTRLAFLNVQAALEALPGVIDIMSEELKWSKDRKGKEWKEAVSFLVSMGLPEKRVRVTRKEVEAGIVSQWGVEEKSFSRHGTFPNPKFRYNYRKR